jgi:hypothetical protein
MTVLGQAFTGTLADLAALTITNGELELVTQWLRGDLTLDRDELIDFLVDLLLTVATDVATKTAPDRVAEPNNDIRA